MNQWKEKYCPVLFYWINVSRLNWVRFGHLREQGLCLMLLPYTVYKNKSLQGFKNYMSKS